MLIPLLLAVQVAGPPSPCADEWSALAALESGSAADSARALDALTALPDRCAATVAAYLRGLRARGGSGRWRERLEIDEALEAAVRQFGPEARLMLAYGYLRYQQGIRVDARRLVERALKGLPKTSPPASPREHAIAAHLLGRILQDEWRDWRSFGSLGGLSEGSWDCQEYATEIASLTRPGAGAVETALTVQRPGPVDINIACPAQFEAIMDADFRLDAGLKRDARRELERHFRGAIELDATYWPPYQALLSELVLEARWSEVERLATDAERAFPRDYRPRALAGLVAYRRGDAPQSALLFDSAARLMPGEVAAVYRQPALVLSLAEERTFASQPEALRQRLAEQYWRSRRVSFLEEGNDRLVEHYARLTEADAIFAIPSRDVAGWNTAPGSAWIRYGRPLKIRDLAVDNGRASFWTYGPDPDLVFTRNLTFAEFRVHEYFSAQMQLMHERLPTRFRPPDVDSVITLEHQIARFRGDSGSVELVVVAGVPDAFRDSASGTRAGVTLLDREFREVARWRSGARPRQRIAVTLRRLRPGQAYNVAVEMKDPDRRLLGQARDTLTADLPEGRPALSDVLLVGEVSGPGTAVTSRSRLQLQHLAGRQIPEGGAFGLVWELYDLASDSAGSWRYRVRIEVKDAEGRSLFTRLLRGGRPDAQSAIVEFDRTTPSSGDRAVEWVNLASDWRAGRYQVILRVEDLVVGRAATATTHFTVTAP